jgi:hypothetical protein
VLLCALRRVGLAYTQFAEATCGTIRLKLLKLGALVRVSMRRIKIAMASACPWQDEFKLGPVEIQDSQLWLAVIQALDGALCSDGRPMGEDGATLFGEGNRPWTERGE